MDDTTCLAQIRRGGRAAQRGVAALYERYTPRFLRHFTRHYGFSPEEAEDIVQDAFVNFVRASKTAREVTAVNAWLWRIAMNCANDALRRQRATRSVTTHDTLEALQEERDIAEHTAVSQGSLPEPELVDCVRRAFQDFAAAHPERAQALILVAFEGWTAQELAAYLGRTYGATREYVSQCRTHLRPYLVRRCGDYVLYP